MVERIREQALAMAPLREHDDDVEVLDCDQNEVDNTEANHVLIDDITIETLARSLDLLGGAPREVSDA